MDITKKRTLVLLLLLIIILFAFNYPFLDQKLQNFLTPKEEAFIDRVIDGDTIVSGNESIRLLGINSPEKGDLYYNEAKEFLEGLVLNKTVELEFGKYKRDKYNRILAYIILEEANINIKLVENGFANFYFPSGKDTHYNKFKQAQENCSENLCEKSTNSCAECIILKEFDYSNQKITFYNNCNFKCELTGWEIKDEGRKKFIFPKYILYSEKEISIIADDKINTWSILYWLGEDYVWTSTGDTFFLRDEKGGLVLWESY